MATSVYYNNNGSVREQMLLEDMVIESIKNQNLDINIFSDYLNSKKYGGMKMGGFGNKNTFIFKSI